VQWRQNILNNKYRAKNGLTLIGYWNIISVMKVMFSIFIILGIIIFIAIYLFSTDDDCGCLEWKYTNGIIVNKYVSTRPMIDDNNIYIMYSPNIIYEYIVNDIKYTGKNSLQYKTLNIEKHIVESYLENFTVNKKIKVKYDKNRHENSAMIDEFEIKIKILFNTISISLILIGIGGLIFFKKIKLGKNINERNKIRHRI